MHLTTKIERVSLAYIAAVAASTGYECVESNVDFDSVDGVLKSATGTRPRIEFRAKGSMQSLLKADHVRYSLSRKNYHDLRIATLTPRLLLVVLLPDDEGAWLPTRRRSWPFGTAGIGSRLRGLPPVDNEQSVTVHVPRTQQLTVDQLEELMARAERGPEL